ncbi:MAG: hypothetical protein J6N81_08965 [Treponema sp.]|nr:hypothetical protein [Treponema sp.]MBO6219682.1 hypothetical protein [Treponema sp.]
MTVLPNAFGVAAIPCAAGVFNEFDESKSSLVNVSDDANTAKADGYFEKAANLGSVKAMRKSLS